MQDITIDTKTKINNMKRLKFLFAMLLLCATVAAHDFEVDGIYYRIKRTMNKTVEVTYKGISYGEYSDEYVGDLIIPESVKNNGITYSVTSIGDDAFYYCASLTSIEMPSSIKSIGRSAFSGCSGLTSIEIPNSVTYIGSSAFSGCSGLTSIEIPNCIEKIEDYTFYGCTDLNCITIGNSVTSIEESAFKGCESLKKIVNFSNLTFYSGSSSNGNIAYYADKIFNTPNVFKDGDFIFGRFDSVNTVVAYLGDDTELTLPADYNV